MSKNNKKRVAVSSHQSQLVDEKAMDTLKYRNLLEDFLVLQKDFVSKKRKLRTVEQKRDVLLAEVRYVLCTLDLYERFLRRRHKFLMKMQSDNHQLEQGSISEKASCMEDLVPRKSSPIGDLDPGKYAAMQYEAKVVGKPLRVNKKPKNGLINGKSVGKKKIVLQDQVIFND
ncbi:unnamed protein product [Dovyalis caffra]|uniref:Uncharacterized protein n=1 Tax=Dovyalis caffra TaxID=77055 RepID=A0AAV1SPL7_9ROSI|nr:unnamed protein product [Dovyalis caffra]